MTWTQALKKLNSSSPSYDGFYIVTQTSEAKPTNRLVFLALMVDRGITMDEFHLLPCEDRKNHQFHVYFLHTGKSRNTTFRDLVETAVQIPTSDAECYWEKLHRHSKSFCKHRWESGSCYVPDCDDGVRFCNYTVVSAAVLTIWNMLQPYFANKPCKVIRLTSTEGKRIVAVVIPKTSVDPFDKQLEPTSLSRQKTIKEATIDLS